MINPHSEFSLSHSLVSPDELGFNIFLSLNFLQKIMMINLPGPHLCPLYPIAKAGRIFSPAGFKAESWPCMPRQVTSSPNTHFFWENYTEPFILTFFFMLFHSIITVRQKGWLSSLLAWNEECWDIGLDANLCSRNWLIIQSRTISIKLLSSTSLNTCA